MSAASSAAALLLLLAGCTAQTLPGVTAGPQPPRPDGDAVPIQGSGEGAVVEYYVRCRSCSVQFTTPSGMGAESEVDGSFDRRVRFAGSATTGAVVLMVTPLDQGSIFDARIRVGSSTVAQLDRRPSLQPVTLSAPLI